MTARSRLLPLAFSVLVAAAAPSDAASAAKVIANPSVNVSEVSHEELRGILLGTKTSLADGTHLEPVLLKSGATHETFVREITGKTPTGLTNYYRTLVFTGRGAMPRMFASEAEAVAYVRATSGAIGYVNAATPADGVKVLQLR